MIELLLLVVVSFFWAVAMIAIGSDHVAKTSFLDVWVSNLKALQKVRSNERLSSITTRNRVHT